ncbi:MAG: hypothetical protein BWX84_02781 [Verrucomicrobia bacterium ADurb.Bin118]|nr:MAG: hypothetical protein BWX84_02781 [Verrucomicrobia bacterium ADurb.Bin118]
MLGGLLLQRLLRPAQFLNRDLGAAQILAARVELALFEAERLGLGLEPRLGFVQRLPQFPLGLRALGQFFPERITHASQFIGLRLGALTTLGFLGQFFPSLGHRLGQRLHLAFNDADPFLQRGHGGAGGLQFPQQFRHAVLFAGQRLRLVFQAGLRGFQFRAQLGFSRLALAQLFLQRIAQLG